MPIFVALLAIKFNPSERSSGLKLVGVCLGLVGVGVLAGGHPDGGGWAVSGRSRSCSPRSPTPCGGLYGQRAVGRVPGPGDRDVVAALRLPGPAARSPRCSIPGPAPGWKSTASLLALAVAGTAIAQLILFRMLRLFGAARVSLVTYLMPVTALIYGATILDEPLRATMLAGLALILGGVALGSGVWRPLRRQTAAAVESAP